MGGSAGSWKRQAQLSPGSLCRECGLADTLLFTQLKLVSGTSDIQNHERINVCCLKPRSLWSFVICDLTQVGVQKGEEGHWGACCEEMRCVSLLVAWSCPTLCDPMDCSPRGSSVYGSSQARILEWVAISSSRGSPQPSDRIHISCIPGGSLVLSHGGSP